MNFLIMLGAVAAYAYRLVVTLLPSLLPDDVLEEYAACEDSTARAGAA